MTRHPLVRPRAIPDAPSPRGTAAGVSILPTDDALGATKPVLGMEPPPVARDPRPDLAACLRDAVWWSVLLALALEVHGADGPRGVYGALHASRCLGAGLARTSGGALRIVPAAIRPAAWPAIRAEWLVPHRAAVAALLVAVAAGERLLAEELAADAAALAAVRRVWPDAQLLTPAEVAAFKALPVVDWRRLPYPSHVHFQTGEQL